MKRIGIFICNYNKKDYLKRNLESVMKQTFHNEADVYVIDNASTDGAPDMVEQEFPDVEVFRNPVNAGGAGGFYRAQRMGVEKGYEYILMLDNDIVMDSYALERLVSFLDKHDDVGMVGASLYLMDEPDHIWVYGNTLDFEHYKIIDGFSDQTEDKLPEVVYCDTVPACCSLVRTACFEKAGYMPVDNFISWDDIEWCWKFRLNGYRIAAISGAKVWHKTAGKVLTNHFSTYYYNRNKFHFFAEYVPDGKEDEFVEWLMSDVFVRTYGLSKKGFVNNVSAIMYAFMDFIYDVRNKAADHKILPYDHVDPVDPDPEKRLEKCEHVKLVEKYEDEIVYEDIWGNRISSREDFYYFRNMDAAKEEFADLFREAVRYRVYRIRNDAEK